MILSTYDKFCNAIECNEIQSAESIFGASDIRCDLISHSVQCYDKDTVISIIKSFTSRGLKEQALSICNDCSNKNCQIKQNLSSNKDVVHYTNERNKLSNKINRATHVLNERIFDIHSVSLPLNRTA